MDLRKLSPSMLLTLGLACGDGKDSGDTTTTVNACLSPPDPTEVETGPCLDIGPLTTTSGNETTSVGPCLSDESSFPSTTTSSGSGSGSSTDTGTGSGSDGTATGDSTFGPCLSMEPTGTGTETGTGTTGMMGDEPPPSRAAALERVLERGTLPPDVVARLRGHRDDR